MVYEVGVLSDDRIVTLHCDRASVTFRSKRNVYCMDRHSEAIKSVTIRSSGKSSSLDRLFWKRISC